MAQANVALGRIIDRNGQIARIEHLGVKTLWKQIPPLFEQNAHCDAGERLAAGCQVGSGVALAEAEVTLKHQVAPVMNDQPSVQRRPRGVGKRRLKVRGSRQGRAYQ